MLISFEGGDAKGSIIGRREQRPRRNTGDNLTAETGCFVFDSLFYEEPVQLL